MTTSDAADQPHPQIRSLRWALALLTLLWAGSFAWLASRPVPLPADLRVEQLTVVEPDGSPTLVLTNSQRPVAATLGGKPVMRDQLDQRRGLPMMLFFDGKGDEVGGLIHGAIESDDGYSAVRQFSLDGYQQDQTVKLFHYQSPGGSRAGLSISDRPAHSIFEAQRQLGLEPSPTSEQLNAAIAALPESERPARLRDLFGTGRIYLGTSRDGSASLILSDGEGRSRLVFRVPREGDPSIQLLGENGEELARPPEN